MATNDMLQNFLLSAALVIDDEIEKQGSTIFDIVKTLEDNGTIFVKKRELLGSVSSLNNLAYIILDWDLIKDEDKNELPDGVEMGSALMEMQKGSIREFIKNVLEQYFIPIFIFTRENIDSIKEYLKCEPAINEALDKSRVFISNKSELANDQVITTLNDWLNRSMSVYTFKIMDEAINKAKHRYFNEMYKCHLDWPCFVYHNLLKDEPADINSDFQEFLMTSFTSTIEPISFNAGGFDRDVELSSQEILKIYGRIKFLDYRDGENVGPHSGDFYVGANSKYLLSISASCDMRKKRYYYIQGQATSHPENKTKSNQCIIRNIIGKSAIFFELNKAVILDNVQECNLLNIDNIEYRRVGRLLEPYISDIQKRYSFYITRTGVFCEPDENKK